MLCFSCATLFSFGQNKHELGLNLPLLKLKSPELSLYHKYSFNREFELRSFIGFQMQTDKEIRSDSISFNEGYIAYQLALGLQRNLDIIGADKFTFYCGTDAYLNSKFIKEDGQSYYGYFYNFGFRPAVGISYRPLSQIAISLESRALLNFNTQAYSANDQNSVGTNYDRRVSFKSFDHTALMLAYVF